MVTKKVTKKKSGTKKKPELNTHERSFLRVVKMLHPELATRISFDDAPYIGNDVTKPDSAYRSDLVLHFNDGEHPYLKGIVIEIQGGTRQGYGANQGVRTGHSTPQAIARDNHKCVLAQMNGYFYLPVVTTNAAYRVAVEVMNEIMYQSIDYEDNIDEDDFLM